MNSSNLPHRTFSGAGFALLLLAAVALWHPTVAAAGGDSLHPDLQRLKSDTRRLGHDLHDGATTLGHQIRHDSRQADRKLHERVVPQMKRNGREFRDQMHRFGTQVRGWWNHLKARLAGEHAGRRPAHRTTDEA